jgi:hypothetical protein
LLSFRTLFLYALVDDCATPGNAGPSSHGRRPLALVIVILGILSAVALPKFIVQTVSRPARTVCWTT